ncbi:MAG: response regulator [Ktedonobacteraceae bacterium]
MAAFILIIDDSICARRILEIALRKAGYETQGFAGGYEALRWLASEEARLPALIILDLVMPKMDGYSVLRHLRKRPATAQTPVIMLSGRSGVVDRLKGRLAGASVYLTKPFQSRTVLAAMHKLLDDDDDAERSEGEGVGARFIAPAGMGGGTVRADSLSREDSLSGREVMIMRVAPPPRGRDKSDPYAPPQPLSI